MAILDLFFGEFRWWRRLRGGQWFYAACPDGGWMRHEPSSYPDPDTEDYRTQAAAKDGTARGRVKQPVRRRAESRGR